MFIENTTAFCTNCACHRQYALTSSKSKNEVRGTSFEYVEHIAHCTECGKELYIAEINDANVQAQEDAYRAASGLITVSEIAKILEKYSIGAGPLAKLLGFGEVTINRYMGGQLPSKSHSDLLLEILASHRKMDEILEQNKDSISPVAYKKARESVDHLNELYGKDRIDVVTRYILNKSNGDVTPMALQKLLYYSQAFFYALFNAELFTGRCQAWARGPVYPDVYYKYREYGFDPIGKPLQHLEEDALELSTRERDFLDAIVSCFGCYSGSILSRITHSEMPWLDARGNLHPNDRCRTEISREIIHEYFKKIVLKYNIINPCDIKKYSSDMYKQIIA